MCNKQSISIYKSDIIKFLPKNLNLNKVTAESVPIIVTRVAADTPTINEFTSPLINALELNNFSYHFKEKPFHTVPDDASLNEKIIKIINGRYKNK